MKTFAVILLGAIMTASCQGPSVDPAPAAPSSISTTPATLAPIASALVVQAKPSPMTITISAVGDCTLGGGVENGIDTTAFDQMMDRHKQNWSYPFSNVIDVFRSDDLTIVNLEGTLTSSIIPIPEGKFHFRGKPEYAKILSESSVEVANLANNHIGDLGPRGYDDTRNALRAAGVGASGNGVVDIRTIKGIEVINLGFTGVYMTRSKVRREIEAHKKKSNLVIVSFHWGVEGTHEVIDIQRELGRLAIDAGADVVLGHHPHVIQAMETYKERHIVHSLGNFVFGANTYPHKLESMIYRETFIQKDDRMVSQSYEVLPVRVCPSLPCKDFKPIFVEGDEKRKFLDWFSNENKRLERKPLRKSHHW